ncbi:hypothetical protein O6H91_18G019000 [Diphasiastrum complanatum]|uniref:Uncharacterized protein n=1 Tax=Diphasiastrum complanatum TaxID=34168 RepID=A0ACC2AYJ6_DIPCM|nr:hypothetical protein O6H91_18G019000 [Diphasiastrum complanatum]
MFGSTSGVKHKPIYKLKRTTAAASAQYSSEMPVGSSSSNDTSSLWSIAEALSIMASYKHDLLQVSCHVGTVQLSSRQQTTCLREMRCENKLLERIIKFRSKQTMHIKFYERYSYHFQFVHTVLKAFFIEQCHDFSVVAVYLLQQLSIARPIQKQRAIAFTHSTQVQWRQICLIAVALQTSLKLHQKRFISICNCSVVASNL